MKRSSLSRSLPFRNIEKGVHVNVTQLMKQGFRIVRRSTIRGLERHPDVCGGAMCIKGTRIPVWLLEQAKMAGFKDRDIIKSYPQLSTLDLIHARQYAKRYRSLIKRQIAMNEED